MIWTITSPMTFAVKLWKHINFHYKIISIMKPLSIHQILITMGNLNMTSVIISESLVIILSQGQILGTGNLPQDSAPICINIDISPEMAAQSAQLNQAFCVTASDWSPITSAWFSVKIKMPSANGGIVTTDNVTKTAWCVKIRIISPT